MRNRANRHVGEHLGLEQESGVVKHQPYLHGAGAGFGVRVDVVEGSLERPARERRNTDLRLVADIHPRQFVLEDVRVNPHARQIGNHVQLCMRHDVLADTNPDVHHHATDRCMHVQCPLGRERLLQLPDLVFGYIEQFKPLARRRQQVGSVAADLFDRTLFHGACVLQGKHVLLLTGHQSRRVQ